METLKLRPATEARMRIREQAAQFGADLDKNTQNLLVLRIQGRDKHCWGKGLAQFIKQKSEKLSIWKVALKGLWFTVVYDKSRSILTECLMVERKTTEPATTPNAPAASAPTTFAPTSPIHLYSEEELKERAAYHKTKAEEKERFAKLAKEIEIRPHVYERLIERGPYFGITPSSNLAKAEAMVRRLLSESKEVRLDPTRKVRRLISNKFEDARYFSVKKKNGADLRFVVVEKNGQMVLKTVEVVVGK